MSSRAMISSDFERVVAVDGVLGRALDVKCATRPAAENAGLSAESGTVCRI
jgi:hypothetical protein